MDWSFIHHLHQIWLARWALLHGAWLTVIISGLSIIFGTLVGVVMGMILAYGRWPLRLPVRFYTDFVRGTPVLVLVFAAYYVPAAIGISLGAISAGILAISVFCSSRISEIVRGALQAVPRGQLDAAKTIGLTFPKSFIYILLPQAIRQMVPTWIITAVEMVKASTLLSAIGVAELILTTQQIIGRTFLTVQFYVVAGVIYFLIDYGIERIGKFVERRFSLE